MRLQRTWLWRTLSLPLTRLIVPLIGSILVRATNKSASEDFTLS